MTNIFKIALLALLFVGCKASTSVDGGKEPEWFRGSSVVSADGTVCKDSLDKDKIDLLYLVSTNVIEARNDDGTPSYVSHLVKSDREFIDMELAYIGKEIGQGDFNYLAPYYHQFTFTAINLPQAQFDEVYKKVVDEVCGIFDYYMGHINDGRKFAIVGFSQGAMLALDILKHSRHEQLQNMVGAYLIGYGVNEEDMKCENVVPATGATGFGHTISFNSVLTEDATWPFVYNNSAVVINPVNWRTDATPANFSFNGDSISVVVDNDKKQLMVTVPDAKPYHEYMNSNPAYKMAHVSEDCLHHWDLLYYTKMIHDNILLRNGPTPALPDEGRERKQ